MEALGDLRGDLVPETPTASNPAKRLALGLRGFVPFVYGPRLFGAVAYRIRTQLNENSKVPAGSGFFPEAFHNAVMGCEGPEEIRRCICALVIRDPEGPLEMERKMDGFKRLLESSGIRVLEIRARGRGKLARMLSALYVGDYAATYLGLLYGHDPSSTDSIAALKRF
jgi:glucose/mannose-6-phosphate isomerase